ncbi:MAG: UDP-N-acetylmuramoyl-L-alanyl-D-glutamate--2,6-diaminopimelate ligase [Acidimicrobiales bacterium]|nr:UDP-N-acetylmuramoyl-L-alanyl-D-glutamate--2,6-diaminopimelate ligase [Acidimicrobiales bacterium]
MRLDGLIAEAGLPVSGLLIEAVGDQATEVLGITMDSHDVRPGDIFACVPGRTADGHAFASAAVSDGAVALLCERQLDVDVPQIVVSSVRRAVGPVSDVLSGRPSLDLTVAAVTGTNGKTTTCAFVRSIFEANGWKATTVGTLTQRRTTPEAPELHALLADWRRAGGRAVAMEVSSHALDQHRTDAVRFAAGVFTNLSPDHLDYHQTMEAYFEAKARLFEPGRVGVAVVNRDDSWGRQLIERIRRAQGDDHLVTWSPDDATEVEITPGESRFTWHGVRTAIHLGGRFNIANAVAAATAAAALGVPADAIAEGLRDTGGVPGRFQKVDAGQPFTVIVDYAHTPDGLAQVIAAVRESSPGRVIVVFGAGGDRDREKRPLMGAAAAAGADLAIVTSDNPRREDPEAIIAEVVSGATDRSKLLVEPDRASAIAAALATAQGGDIVVIAGKGHEKDQEIAGRVFPFDDVEVADAALRRILGSRSDA